MLCPSPATCGRLRGRGRVRPPPRPGGGAGGGGKPARSASASPTFADARAHPRGNMVETRRALRDNRTVRMCIVHGLRGPMARLPRRDRRRPPACPWSNPPGGRGPRPRPESPSRGTVGGVKGGGKQPMTRLRRKKPGASLHHRRHPLYAARTGALEPRQLDRVTDFYLTRRGRRASTILGMMGEAGKLSAEEALSVVRRVTARARRLRSSSVLSRRFGLAPMVRAVELRPMDAGAPASWSPPPHTLKTGRHRS